MFPSKTELWVLIAALSATCIILAMAIWFNTKAFDSITNSNYKSMASMKADCEKSLQRDKECVLVFDYVSAENDYENN